LASSSLVVGTSITPFSQTYSHFVTSEIICDRILFFPS
jgi:hypothetical protein